jgi:hypothetical protein
MQCLTNVVFHPYKKAEYYNGVVIGYMTSVYSYNCNSNWDQAELTSYAINQGWGVQTFINTTDSQGSDEVVCYPDESVDCITDYKGATGWPAVSNMVDGSNTTYSEFIVYNGGTRIVDDKTIQQ